MRRGRRSQSARCMHSIKAALLAAIVMAALRAQNPFAGAEACGVCHEDIGKAFAKAPHKNVQKSCESCHGPGAKHAESAAAADIRNPAKLTPAATDRVCLTCHLNQPGHLKSSHSNNLVACTTCHSVHGTGAESLVARKNESINKQCQGCHLTVAAQFQKPFHHKLPEGAMTCVDCHNPHGSMRPAMMQSFGANEPGCFKCHGDKRGPFTFEHGPVRFSGCSTCHVAHGSANPRMLERPRIQQVCLECHSNLPAVSGATARLGVIPPSFHDLRSPRYQNCTVCHQKIHGSYVDRNLLK
jgi:DmsE family decaheme c-type cytochrome